MFQARIIAYLILPLSVVALETPERRALSAQSAVPRDLATRVIAEIAGSPFGVSRSVWRASVPAASWRDYRGAREFPPESVLPQPEGLWCSEAVDELGGLKREAVFYGIRTETPLDCRLEQLHYIFEGKIATDGLFKELNQQLAERFREPFWTEGERRKPYVSSVLPSDQGTGYSTGSWKNVRFWFAPTQSVFLYRQGETIQLFTRDRILEQTLNYDASIFGLTSPSGPAPIQLGSVYGYGTERLLWETINAIRSRFPAAAGLLLDNRAIPDQRLVRQSALQLLDARSGASTDNERALWAVAADQVLRRLWVDRPPNTVPELAEMMRRGMTFSASPFDQGQWFYDENLIASTIQRYPGTHWAELAFLSRLDHGWLRSWEVGNNYHPVIAEGLAWLEKHPQSRLAVPVMYDVAQAYETWWSLSMATEDEDLVTASEHKDGSNEARIAAVRWFERIATLAPDSVQAVYANRVLIQLRIGIDTGERRFYSVYP
jgi:hypothetical protein